MVDRIKLGDIAVEVVRKEIKNVHLSVYPPTGRVRISAPLRMDLDTIRVFAISKLGWIKKQQARQQSQERETPREFLEKESHYFKGRRYLLKIREHNAPPRVELKHSHIALYVRRGTDREKMPAILDEWYRHQLKAELPAMIDRWEKIMNVRVKDFGIKKMRTRWGTCNREAARIWLNLELAKKPTECLEYIVVHEMAHLVEKTHNARFVALMDRFMPMWPVYKEALSRLPVKHENWRY
ncbi:MAG: SprT family zinc-dependent metalloprotease [Desulfobulbales bacterium]|nr:SprT family zinc-dependent metalloprotease [Desulfobulbales bacterium]